METILCKDTSKQIWDSMERKYQGSTRVKRQHLQALCTEFETLRMNSGESVTNYFSRSDKTEDTAIVEKILRSLTPKLNYVVCAIEEANDIEELSIDELQGSLLVHEKKLQRQDQEEQALKVATNQKTMNVVEGKDEDSTNEATLTIGKYKAFPLIICHKYGHYKSECRTNLGRYVETTNFAVEKEGEILLMACQEKEASSPTLWYLDTGCSNHMCGNKEAFSSIDESHCTQVKLGDASTLTVMGK
ncbi:uncharacterized protein [Gossypium hirsutum]|uniref:Retrovirus-related Pol polyprotein from transposon TNT 1-94-like beta-barrel domain-containing protein n=1 Tax=Gossypium hirsutum TaxID=3635 RepID=A0ABM3AZU2_GOSHI|nr:uncharacterized protein LOC121223233 [Gossypium hirsutum]